MVRTRLLLIVLFLSATLPVSAQRGGRDDPSPVVRSLVVAMYSNDVAGYNKLTMPHPLRSRLTSGGRVNENGLRELKEDPDSLQIKQKRPFEFQGKEAKPGANGQYPIGTTGHYVVAHHSPMVMGLVKQADGNESRYGGPPCFSGGWSGRPVYFLPTSDFSAAAIVASASAFRT